MRQGRASRTAEHNALFRALETRGRVDCRLIDDPLAATFLSPGFAFVVRAARVPAVRAAVLRYIDDRWPGVRTAVVARTRLIDDGIATILADGGGAPGLTIGQVVVLGAGFDTRPYRLPGLAARAVFEVDHPDTQRRKRARLRRHDVDCDHVRFAPTDFTDGSPGAALAAVGFDPAVPTLVLWEGVTNYLDADAVDATLKWCATTAPGSHVIFTYVDRRLLDDPTAFAGAERMLATIRRAGESMTFGLDPDELAPYLRERGLDLVSDLGARTFRRRYYGPRADRMAGHEFYRVVHARIP